METTKTDTTAKRNISFRGKPIINRFSWVSVLLLLIGISFFSPLPAAWAKNDITNFAITSTPAADDTYKKGENIQVSVTWEEAVKATGKPYVGLTLNTISVHAHYTSGSGTATLVFQYTVRPGVKDTGGFSVGSGIDLNGGSLQNVSDNAFPSVRHSTAIASSHNIDGGSVATLNSVSITSSAGSDNTYGLGDTIQVSAKFSENVAVDTTGGTPQIGVTIGSTTRQATYSSGTGRGTLVFEYTAVAGDEDTDGISIAENALALNGGTITDVPGFGATLTHSAVATQASHKVDAVVPTVNSLSITSNAGTDNTYIAGDVIQVSVTFSKTVFVTGTPQIGVTIGSNTRQATYSSGTNTATLLFQYTVVAGDTDTDGIAIVANALALNGGTIKRNIGNNSATLTHAEVTTQASHKVDTTAPTINSISITSTPNGSNTYTPTEVIKVEVTFSETVVVTGIPQLPLTIGSNTRQALYKSGTNTVTLAFEYTVASGDEDTDGIAIATNALNLNGGTITDVPGTAATVTHTAVATQASHKVDGITPTVQMVSITSSAGSDNTYIAGDVIQVQVAFTENIVVTGTPQIGLTIGSNTRQVDYGNLAGSTSLAFAYTVVVGDVDADGVSIAANSLTLNGGTIKDTVGNVATVTHLALPAGTSHKVDATAPIINSVSITSDAGNDKAYVVGDVIQVSITFSETVAVTGTPQIGLTIGSNTRQATYQSGSNTAKLVFEYTVVAGDTDTDGIATTMNALALNGGTIKDGSGTAATLTHAAVTTQILHKVDTTAPTLNSLSITSSAGADNTYISGDVIQVSATFSETVVVTGTPQIGLTIGSNTRQATYQSGSNTATLLFQYTVATGDVDTDGISIAANALALNSGTIKDGVSNVATLTHTAVAAAASHKVDAVAPTINSLSITSTPSSNNTYAPDEVITVTVVFSETVAVTGNPQIGLTIGSTTRQAIYNSGTNTATLLFQYTVATGDEDADGISIAANALALNGGTIKDAIGNVATLTYSAVATQASHKVDTAEPTVRSVVISSGAGVDETYKTGDRIEVEVTFNEIVVVTGPVSGNTPQIGLTIGNTTRPATYQSGTGGVTLTFAYTVVAGDTDTDGIAIAADALTLNSATITNASNVNAILDHSEVTTQASHKVDTTAPTINSLSITSSAPSNNTYVADDVIQVSATFSETVLVTGTPQIALTIGSNVRQATYQRGDNTATLLFEYTVITGDEDTDGIAIAANALALNNGTILDSVGNAATLTHTAVAAAASHKVDAVAPTINTGSPAITSAAGADDTYVADDVIQVSVTFSETVLVTGTPQIGVTIGSNTTRQATYLSGTNTATLLFQYTVATGDEDTDGIAIAADAIGLGIGTIKDSAGNVATLTHSEVALQASHKVDTIAPTINSISITSDAGTDNTYVVDDVIQVQVAFSETVVVTGTPQLSVLIGNNTGQAPYQSGNNSATLTFTYTVVAGDNDADGIAIAADALDLNGGTIADSVDNTADLTHSAVPPAASHKVDTIQPTIIPTGITIANTMITVGSKIQVKVVFSETVVVDTTTGTPSLTLTMDTASIRRADYESGTGTPADPLLFTYTLTPGDSAPNGISIAANALALNSATITDSAGNAAIVTHQNVLADPSRKVDTVPPTLSSISIVNPAGNDGTYIPGEIIRVSVTFSEAVIVTGTPSVTLTIGTATRQAAYESVSEDSITLVFAYRVTANDIDTDGISIAAGKLALNGGSIVDSSGNPATLTHQAIPTASLHKVDGVQPAVSSISITSTGPYSPWKNIEITVATTKPVNVTGNATLTLIIGNAGKTANYYRGSGTNALVFQYTIAAGDGDDANGVSVRANSLSLNGGSIADALGNALSLNHDALGDAGVSHRVDTTPPQVNSVAFTSAGPYGIGSDIDVTVMTNEPVTASGNATLIIIIGTTERMAALASGTGTSALVFRYRVTPTDPDDANGVSVKANSLMTNGGTMTDSVGNALVLSHSGVGHAGNTQMVGTSVSTIRSVAFTSTGPYTVDDIIKVTVGTTDTVTVTGTPRISLIIGATLKHADYVSGSGSTSLVFEYTVVEGDEDEDGVEILQNALLNHNGSTIRNKHHTDLNLSHASVAADPKHAVDTTEPDIVEVVFAPDAPPVYTTGKNIEVVVGFEENGVQVTPGPNGEMPTVTLLFGSNSAPNSQKKEVEAPYTVSKPGSTKLIFSYPVTSDTPIDTDGVQIKAGSLWIPPGGSIHDLNGNPIQSTQTEGGAAIVAIKPVAQVSSPPILPAVTSTGIIFNEFLNASNDKHDWVELRNTTENKISLGGWKLDLSTQGTTHAGVYEFPEIALPAGAIILLMNARHKETPLELSYAYTYRYLILPKLRLPERNFSLIMRDASGGVADVIGDSFGNIETANPIAIFQENQAYFRVQPDNPGYEASAWQQVGYQAGLGYKRNAPERTSLGTPGYPRSALTQQREAETVPVSISEVMYATGSQRNLPQWIELYNTSKTNVVSLQGWRLQVEGYDPDSRPVSSFTTFNIQANLQILPNQTVLIATKNGRNSRHFPEPRVYNLTVQNPEKLKAIGGNAQLIKETGFAIVLRDDTGKQVDIAGNLDGENKTRDEPKWKLPNCITKEGTRCSIIRQQEEGAPLKGIHKSSWFRALKIQQPTITYWGHPSDVGNPGYKKGGPLPVQLSSFNAERTEAGCVITWQTESELENAGFNVLRSETKNGPFKVVNPRMIQGAGTTSERNTYQYIDRGTKPRNHYYYRLEEISFAGTHQTLTTQRLRRNISPVGQQLTTLGAIKKHTSYK